MKSLCFAAATLLSLSSAAFATDRSTYRATLEAGASTPRSGIVSTGPGTYERFVRDQSQCSRDEVEIPTWSASGVFLGRTCGRNPNGG
jgi:hypothetical protein